MILGAVAFLRENPAPSASDIARGMRGHVCRCGTYPRISAAIARAAKAMASGDAPHTVPTSGTSRAPQGTP
jgi:aerobic-type carbon monoxide dehydrogenase small subunit (CoxS/CutS family)